MQKNTYDYVEEAVKEFWNKTYPQDVIVFFEQKYEHETTWEERHELVESESDTDYENMTFLYDFCEGQTDFRLLCIVPLYDVCEYYMDNNIVNRKE